MPYTVFKAIGLLQTDDDYKFDLLSEYDLNINLLLWTFHHIFEFLPEQ